MTQRKPIQVPVELKDRLDRIAKEMMESYESGRMKELNFVERNGQAMVPIYEVISRALDEYENHKARSAKRSKKETK